MEYLRSGSMHSHTFFRWTNQHPVEFILNEEIQKEIVILEKAQVTCF